MEDLLGETVFGRDLRAATELEPDFACMGRDPHPSDRYVCDAPRIIGQLLAQKKVLQRFNSPTATKEAQEEMLMRMSMLHNEAKLQRNEFIRKIADGRRLALRNNGRIVQIPQRAFAETEHSQVAK